MTYNKIPQTIVKKDPTYFVKQYADIYKINEDNQIVFNINNKPDLAFKYFYERSIEHIKRVQANMLYLTTQSKRLDKFKKTFKQQQELNQQIVNKQITFKNEEEQKKYENIRPTLNQIAKENFENTPTEYSIENIYERTLLHDQDKFVEGPLHDAYVFQVIYDNKKRILEKKEVELIKQQIKDQNNPNNLPIKTGIYNDIKVYNEKGEVDEKSIKELAAKRVAKKFSKEEVLDPKKEYDFIRTNYHYAVNRHHFFEPQNTLQNVEFTDVFEMVADVVAMAQEFNEDKDKTFDFINNKMLKNQPQYIKDCTKNLFDLFYEENQQKPKNIKVEDLYNQLESKQIVEYNQQLFELREKVFNNQQNTKNLLQLTFDNKFLKPRLINYNIQQAINSIENLENKQQLQGLLSE